MGRESGGAMSKYPEHGAHQFCGNHGCVICALTAEEIKAIWLGCTSIDNEAFCGEFSRKLLAAAVAAANKTPNAGGEPEPTARANL